MLKKMNFDQFLMGEVCYAKVGNIVSQEKRTASYGEEKPEPVPFNSLVKATATGHDQLYVRDAVTVNFLTVDILKQQYIQQMHDRGSPQLSGDNLQKLIDEAHEIVADNFGTPTSVIKLDEKTWVLADTTPDSVQVKKLGHNHGCIIVYAPTRHVILNLTRYSTDEDFIQSPL